MESRTTFIRDFESVFVPGLLQTPDNARSRLAVPIDYAGAPSDGLDDAVTTRMQRQQVLYQPGKKIHIVMTEAALRYRLCDEAAMAAQLDRLTVATTIPHIRFGVIPLEARYRAPPTNGFWIFDRNLVRVETATAEQHSSHTALIVSSVGFARVARAFRRDRGRRDRRCLPSGRRRSRHP